ncbi:MAG: TetR/AcrR family transcriptional regulator [Chloroflexota bacterium]|nr:TetR/AcrR family transcriptional regulator [Chloroflexota bacterium]
MLNSEARQRVLDVAERLFAERGFRAVTLKDIAGEVGIRHASLYHHFPRGKEQMFIEVTERNMHRHRAGIESAIAAYGDVRGQLKAVAGWLLSQPPIDLIRMTHSDMPAIDATEAWRLSELAAETMIEPIHTLLQSGQARGEIEHGDLGVIAGGVLGMIGSLHSVPEDIFTYNNVPVDRAAMAHTLIDVMLDGLIKRE